jgi:hypothetical protein
MPRNTVAMHSKDGRVQVLEGLASSKQKSRILIYSDSRESTLQLMNERSKPNLI